jgi:hypothetical protein
MRRFIVAALALASLGACAEPSPQRAVLVAIYRSQGKELVTPSYSYDSVAACRSLRDAFQRQNDRYAALGVPDSDVRYACLVSDAPHEVH